MERSNDSKRLIQAKNQPRPFHDLKKSASDVSERCRNKWKKMETAQATTFSSLFSRTKATVDDSGLAKRRTRVVDPYVRKDISKLVAMEERRNTLLKHLVGGEEESTPTPQLKMACVLGAAGMGKTTLARLLYEAIQDKFQARAFVSVTSSHNMTEVLASIYQQVQGLLSHTTVVPLAGIKTATAEKDLIDVTSNFLKDKRYLVIIDDIWHCGEWETIKKSLPDNNKGSRIVTTSRVIAITEKWRDDFDALVHEINHRNEVKKLIAVMTNMAGEGFDRGHPIVDMCRDMPLALHCMILALAKLRECREQQELRVLGTPALQDEILKQVMGNGIKNTPGFKPLVESLELGYNHLPHHMLKTCLLYCSIYPEDHDFNKDDLVTRWIAEGFVCKQEAAKDYFDELVSRGFIGGNNYGMHPMMRNYLRRELREHNFITCTSDPDIPCSPTGRLYVDYWPASSSSNAVDPLSGINWHRIRSLVVFKDAERVPYNHFEYLRVLGVQPDSGALENQHVKDMCGMLRLMQLPRLCGEGITEIPADIGRLKYLESLEVTETNITRLPAEICDLKQLKTLDMTWNRELTELPREMGNLQHLETLIIIGSNIREQAWEIIVTLKKIKNLDLSGNPQLSGIPRDIGELQQLKKLDVSYDCRITELPKEIGKLQHLETLNVSATGIKELPREIGNLQRLVYLDLFSTAITKVPRDIGNLQHLEYIDLRSTKVRKMPREIGGLKNLKHLHYEVGILPLEAGQLSKLEWLPECARQAWNNSHLVSLLAGEILSFDTQGYNEALINHTMHMHVPRWIKAHFNNIGILDIRICKLEEDDLTILREMPNLQQLILRFDGVPRKPITISGGGGGFAKLEILTVDSQAPRITFQEGAMPILYWLIFEFQFYSGPPNTEPPMAISHLVYLEKVTFQCNEWYREDSPCISATIDVVRKEAREHTNEITFEVSGHEEIFPENHIAQSSEDRSDACSSSSANEIEEIIPA